MFTSAKYFAPIKSRWRRQAVAELRLAIMVPHNELNLIYVTN